MNLPRQEYLARVRQQSSYSTLRFLVDAGMVLAVAAVVIRLVYSWQNQAGPQVLLGAASLAEILLIFAGRELLRMFADVADIAIERETRPEPEQGSRPV